ncbi:isochorismatase domain-containing protein 2-like [Neocloeon triangulifer]|uniref:isochorismatase domain-containing protein 2-like n=1 Tax=Neocloeon triangulifer TaxID=2078957 RepID=UPI00286F2BC1|nr:isochorismatase domain-containing protein 2-like [Neocloeon triangulifer]
MAGRLATRLSSVRSTLFLCDMQEKFRPSIQYFNEVVFNSSRLLKVAKLLDMPVVCTEQYPKGLGATVPELGIQEFGIVPVEKTQFSMVLPQILDNLKRNHDQVNTVILCGIETHACIHETALDLLEKGYGVHVVVDACSSRSMLDRKYAFKRLESAGAILNTCEGVVLALAQDSKHPKFRELQKIIWEVGPDTGLLR